ncbi:MAG: hypothetical protein H6563_13040 [Lewinellaceae bacterium]|nr:hypothetical protein [Lewinellaceae bacterium]
MKTTLFSLAFVLAIPFLSTAQTDPDKELKDELKDVKRKIEQIFKDLEEEDIFGKVDSVFQQRWPEVEAELEDAWRKAEPKIDEVGRKIDEIADEIVKEVKEGVEGIGKEKEKPRREQKAM